MPLIPKQRPTLYICAYTCGFLLGYIMDAVCPEAHPDLTYANRPNTWFLVLVQHYQRVMLAARNMANSSKPFASILTNIVMVSRSRADRVPRHKSQSFREAPSSPPGPGPPERCGAANSSFIIDDEIAILRVG